MVQCQGLTVSGNKCKNQAIEGRKFCHLHIAKKSSAKKAKVMKTKAKKVSKAKSPLFTREEKEVYKKRGKGRGVIIHEASPDVFEGLSPNRPDIANKKCKKLFEIYGQKEGERILDQNIEMGQLMKGTYKASPLKIKKKTKKARSPKVRSALGKFDEESIFMPEQFD
jgi:hypothetical protein